MYVAALDSEWNIVHTRVDDCAGIAQLLGSKYAYSKGVAEAIADAIAQLESDRKVLFSGMPCQVSAMCKRVDNNPHLLCIVTYVAVYMPLFWCVSMNNSERELFRAPVTRLVSGLRRYRKRSA